MYAQAMTIPDKVSRSNAKISEFGGVDRPKSTVHKGEHVPTPEELLRLAYTTADESNSTDPYEDAFLGQ